MKKFLTYLLIIIIAACAGFLLRGNVLQTAQVAGNSMSPTLQSGDYVLITNYSYRNSVPARGDVVQAEIPGRPGAYLKRVIGLPGETLQITDGTMYIDGQPLREYYAAPSDDEITVTLGPDEFFLMGDNRPQSYDSREEDFGAVRASCFLGKVRAVLWPPRRIGFISSN